MNPRFLLPAAAALATAVAVLFLTRGEAPVQAGSLPPPPASTARAAEKVGENNEKPRPIELAGAPIESYQRDLLELAFRAASGIPKMPHLKARSRAQEQAYVACMELEQPLLALDMIERIDNWRRATGYADLAFYLAQKDTANGGIQRYLELARKEVDKMELQGKAEEEGFDGDDEAVEIYQAWRKDRIRAKIARTYLCIGQPERAIEFEQGLEPSESGIVEVARARTMKASEVETVTTALETVSAEGNLERVSNALNVGIVLLERFYANEEVRKPLEEKLDACLEKSPAMFRVDFLISLAASALDKADTARALELVARAEGVLASSPLAIEDDLPLRARLAGLRYRAGEHEPARAAVAAAVEKFQAEREHIANLDRANVLVPIAEVYAAMGDAPAALATYRSAAADGAENPNGVPRAEDLVALCCSMAQSRVSPDSDLWLLLNKTNGDLREPW